MICIIFIRTQPFFFISLVRSFRFCRLSSAFRSFFHNSHSSSVSVFHIFFSLFLFHKLFFLKIIHSELRTDDNRTNERVVHQPKKKWYQSKKAYMRMVFYLSDITNVAKSFQKTECESIGWQWKCEYGNESRSPVFRFNSMLLFTGGAVAILIYVFVEQTHIYADLRLIRSYLFLACVSADDENGPL